MNDGMEITRSGRRFAMVYEWLLDTKVSANAVLLFAVMDAKYADRVERQCWPSRSTLAKHMGVSRSTVDRAMTELQEVRAVRVTRRRDAKNEWTSSLYELAGASPFDAYLPPGVGVPSPTGASQTRTIEPESTSNADAARARSPQDLSTSPSTVVDNPSSPEASSTAVDRERTLDRVAGAREALHGTHPADAPERAPIP